MYCIHARKMVLPKYHMLVSDHSPHQESTFSANIPDLILAHKFEIEGMSLLVCEPERVDASLTIIHLMYKLQFQT